MMERRLRLAPKFYKQLQYNQLAVILDADFDAEKSLLSPALVTGLVSTTPPHVMLVNGSLHGGGAEHVIATLARHLRELGHRVTIAVVHGVGEVLEALRLQEFDVVTTSGGPGSTSATLRRLIEQRGVLVAHSHDLRSLIDTGLCRLRSQRFVHMHTFHFGNYPHLAWRHLAMEGLAARVPDALVTVGNAQRATVAATLRLPAARVRTIWNGSDYQARPDWSGVLRNPAVTRIGSLSSFGEQKGLPTLLEAARMLRDDGHRFRLVLVGEGPMRRELEGKATALGLADCVEFTGWRPDAAATLLPTFDIFVQSSYWEAMSVVILEAMAARVPILATTVGENAAVLAADQSAVLVPPRDARALARGLARLIADVSLRTRLADTAYAAYERDFTGRAMANRHVAAYRECLESRGLGQVQ